MPENWPFFDTKFLNDIKRYIAPKKLLTLIKPPGIITSVALHIRKGSSSDPPLLSKKPVYADVSWPPKFPPNHFYIEQIKYLHVLLDYQPLYVFVFTDSKTPQNVINEIKKPFIDTNIIFECRGSFNNYSNNVLEDLFSMSTFDYLVRPDSGFSMIAQIIGTHKIAICPHTWHWQDSTLIIDESKVMFDDGTYTIKKEIYNSPEVNN